MIVEIAAFNPIGVHSGTALSGTATLLKPDGATSVLVQCTSGTARYTYGTATPGTASGFQIAQANAPTLINVTFGTALKICPEAGTVQIAYQWGG